MESKNQEVAALVRKIAGLHAAIAKLPSLSPSPEADALFTDLVAACVMPSHVDVAKLGTEDRTMRDELVRLCSDAVARLEARCSDDAVAAALGRRPLGRLARFPYFGSYVGQSDLEHGLLACYAPGLASPARVAFVGSGSLPLSSLVLAARHMPRAHFDNYDRCAAANDRARRLVLAVAGGDRGVGACMAFHTADVSDLTRELGAYDVVFLAASVGVAEADVVAHLGRHMAPGAALVVRSAHGARAFLCPVVEPEDVARAGFDVLTVCHPDDDEIINSVVVARKAAAAAPDGPRRNGYVVAPPVVIPPPCGCCKAKAKATVRFRGGSKRPPRNCHLDAMNEARWRAW